MRKIVFLQLGFIAIVLAGCGPRYWVIQEIEKANLETKSELVEVIRQGDIESRSQATKELIALEHEINKRLASIEREMNACCSIVVENKLETARMLAEMKRRLEDIEARIAMLEAQLKLQRSAIPGQEGGKE